MKISKKLFVIMVVLSLIVAGCTNTTNVPTDNDPNISKEEATEVSKKEPEIETLKKSRPRIVYPFLEKFSSDVTAADLGIYIRDNIENATKDEADEMIQWLLIYQNEIINDFSSKIWEEEYISIFMDDMKGIFDYSKISEIQDEIIKNDFKNLINSFVTVENYFDYPVVNTNWDDLVEYSSYLSDDFSEIIRIKKKENNYEYERYDLDVIGLSKDIVRIEDISKESDSAFIRKEAKELWRSLTSNLLLGPENSYIYHYTGKNTPEYKSLMTIKSKYPDSILKDIILEIDLVEIEDINQIVDMIYRKLQFGLNSDNYLRSVSIETPNGEYDILEIYMPSNMEKQNRINSLIKSDIEEFIKDNTKDRTYSLTIDQGFQNNKYISYKGFLTVTDSNGNDLYLDFKKTLDYIEEKFITLEDFFDADFSFIKEYLEEVSNVKVDTLPNFNLTDYDIEITVNDGTDNVAYITLEHRDLLKYFTLEELLGNK